MSPSGRSGNTSNSSEGKTCHVRNRRTSRQNPGTARAARPTHGPDDDRDDGTRPGIAFFTPPLAGARKKISVFAGDIDGGEHYDWQALVDALNHDRAASASA